MMAVPSGSSGPITATIDPATLSGPWQAVALPRTSLGQLIPQGAGKPAVLTTWYRVRLAGLEPGGGTTTTHLYLVRWQAVGQIAIYGDGRLLYRSRGSRAWNVFRHPALFIPLNQAPDAPPPRTLLIRVDSLQGTIAALSSLWVGDSDPLYRRYALREWLEYQIPFMCSAAFLALGFFSLAVWLRRPREHLYLLFFATAVCVVTRRWHFYNGLEQLPIGDAWFTWLIINALAWQIVFLHFFLGLLHRRGHPWLGRVLIGLTVICTILTLPTPLPMPSLVQLRPAIYVGLIVEAVVVSAVGWYSSRRAGSREGLLLAGGNIIALPLGISDWLRQNILPLNTEGFYLTPYAAAGLFALYSYVMFRRYVGAIDQVEKVNAGLEARLQAREVELAESYRRLRDIEQREMLSEERARLVQDMHDGLGSSLMSALRVVEHGKANEVAVADVLKACIDDLKLTIDSMEPAAADLLLLLATLRYRLGPRLESTGIALRWEVQDVPALNWLDPRHALQILRILQEAFTNVIKHTQADQIRVATAAADGGVHVTITDNGQGFDLDQALQGGGKGLSNQLRRAQTIGGQVAWHSDAQGTRFSLWLPMQKIA